jgi:hypothetical protein
VKVNDYPEISIRMILRNDSDTAASLREKNAENILLQKIKK